MKLQSALSPVPTPRKVLTPKQLERLNKTCGHLKGDEYLNVLHKWEQKFGYREPVSQYN